MVEMIAQPGQRAAFLEELKDILVATRGWDGSEGVEVYLDEQDPDRIVLILHWASHGQHAAYAQWRQESGTSVGLSPLLTAEPKRRFIEPVAV
ncbi:MAG: antibiotic biosynthesis monooxygenase [Candidatus Dormiibacterota bacterium]